MLLGQTGMLSGYKISIIKIMAHSFGNSVYKVVADYVDNG
jgi:hypothetical protein